MGIPTKHTPAKLIVGAIYNDEALFEKVKKTLVKKFGPLGLESRPFDFVYTKYYEKEVGPDLKRKFLVFRKTVPTENCYRVKLYANSLERRFSEGKRRKINIDPGYFTLAKLVLFTTKNRSHRIALGNGIYADLELTFENKTFKPLDWTYPDYRSACYIDFFNSARNAYAESIKEKEGTKCAKR